MATFDGFELNLERAGAVFLITEPAGEVLQEELPGGEEVEIAAGSRIVRVSSPDSISDVDLIAETARAAADRVLDMCCLNSGGAHLLGSPESLTIAWSGTPPKCILRVYSEGLVEFSGSGTATLTDGQGHEINPPPPPTPEWHESMRYFRMSQTTVDLLDGFRNIYLALESVLSEIDPHRKLPIGPWEPEKAWFKRALSIAEGIMQKHGGFQTLSQRFDDHPPAGNPVDAIYRDLYTAARTATFHAKTNRGINLPQRQEDREKVAAVMQRYAGLYADIAEARFGTRYLRSSVGPGFVQGMRSWMEQLTVGLSPNSYPDTAAVEGARADDFIDMNTQMSPKHDEPFAVALLGAIPPTDLPPEIKIRGFGAIDNDGVQSVTDLQGILSADGAMRLEHLMKMRVAGRAFKRRYTT